MVDEAYKVRGTMDTRDSNQAQTQIPRVSRRPMVRLRPERKISRFYFGKVVLLVMAVLAHKVFAFPDKERGWELMENDTLEHLEAKVGARMVFCEPLRAVAVFGGYEARPDRSRAYTSNVDLLDIDSMIAYNSVDASANNAVPSPRSGHFLQVVQDLQEADPDACWILTGSGIAVDDTSLRRRLRTRGWNSNKAGDDDDDDDDDDKDPDLFTQGAYVTAMAEDLWLGRITKTENLKAKIEWFSVDTSEVSSKFLKRAGTVCMIDTIVASENPGKDVALSFGIQEATPSAMKTAGSKIIRLFFYGGAEYDDRVEIPVKAFDEVIDVQVKLVYTSMGLSDSQYDVSATSVKSVPVRGFRPDARFGAAVYPLRSEAGSLSGFSVAGGRSAALPGDPEFYKMFEDMWFFDVSAAQWDLVRDFDQKLRRAQACVAPQHTGPGAMIFGGVSEIDYSGYASGQLRYAPITSIFVEAGRGPSSRCGDDSDVSCVHDREFGEPDPGFGYACCAVDRDRFILLGGIKPDGRPHSDVWVLHLFNNNLDPDAVADPLFTQLEQDLHELLEPKSSTATVRAPAAAGIVLFVCTIVALYTLAMQRRRASSRSVRRARSYRQGDGTAAPAQATSLHQNIESFSSSSSPSSSPPSQDMTVRAMPIPSAPSLIAETHVAHTGSTSASVTSI